MKAVLALLGAVFAVSALVFFGAVIGAASGAVGGWITGMFFPATMGHVATALGFTAPYQVGAAAGFFGGFVRSKLSSK